MQFTEKLRGGYYTPQLLSDWICRWAIRSDSDRVLEPSCGDGVFVLSAVERIAELSPRRKSLNPVVVGVEISGKEIRKSDDRLGVATKHGRLARLETADFFDFIAQQTERDFDCVVGNPPFIRYQNFPEPSRSRAMRLMELAGLRPNKLTNIWVPFVVGAVQVLRENGRLAFVLPAELLQVSYAAQLRSFLVDKFASLQIFCCNHLFFESAEQEIVVLLAEGKRFTENRKSGCRIAMRQTSSIQELLSINPAERLNGRSRKVIDLPPSLVPGEARVFPCQVLLRFVVPRQA